MLKEYTRPLETPIDDDRNLFSISRNESSARRTIP